MVTRSAAVQAADKAYTAAVQAAAGGSGTWAAVQAAKQAVSQARALPEELCPICRERPQDPTTRPDARGVHWCSYCLDDFDSIDPGERF